MFVLKVLDLSMLSDCYSAYLQKHIFEFPILKIFEVGVIGVFQLFKIGKNFVILFGSSVKEHL